MCRPVSAETMKNLTMTEARARFGMTAAAFERLLILAGWMVDGVFTERPFTRGYLTKDRRVTLKGLGYLDESRG